MSREIIDATRQLAVLARLGYPLADGLKQCAGKPRWLGKEGDTLSEAVRRYPRVFSPFYAEMVAAAEASQKPDRVLTRLSEWLEQADRLESELRSALLYPYLTASMLLLQFGLLCYLAPDWARLWGGGGLWMALAILAVLLFVGFQVAVFSLGATRMAGWVPGFRAASRAGQQALWVRALGSLVGAGVDLPPALEYAARVVSSPDLKRSLAGLGADVKRGTSLGKALERHPELDPQLAWAAAAGEEREDLAPVLLYAADGLDEQARHLSGLAVSRAEPLAIVVLGLGTALACLLFWLPYYSSLETLLQ